MASLLTACFYPISYNLFFIQEPKPSFESRNMVPSCWKPFSGFSISLGKNKIKSKLLSSIKPHIIWPLRTSLISSFCPTVCWSSHTGLPDSQTCQTFSISEPLNMPFSLFRPLSSLFSCGWLLLILQPKFDSLREAFPNLQSKHYLFASVIELPVCNYKFVYMLNFIFTTMQSKLHERRNYVCFIHQYIFIALAQYVTYSRCSIHIFRTNK